MSKNYDSFWGTPEKIRKLLDEAVGELPEVHFLYKISKENAEALVKNSSRQKVVLFTIFPDNE